jgi:hypothetical protein
MPFDGSGNFVRNFPPGGWQGDATANIKIRSDRHDQHDNDLASGLSNALCKDGQSSPTADIPMNGKKIVNLGAPVNPNDAATKAYADVSKPSTTGLVISGSDDLGRLSFTSPTGANGLAFTGADLSWIARLATAAGPGSPPVPPATLNRMVLNDKPDGLGTDVAVFNDNGNASVTGTFTATGQVLGGTVKSNAAVYANAAYLNTDGNISGSIWLNFGANDAYTAINARIEARGQAWANDRVSQLQYRKVSLGSIGTTAQTAQLVPAGAVATGVHGGTNNTIIALYYMYLQVYDPVRGWVGFSG